MEKFIFGGHNAYGMEAVRFYTKVKTVTSKWPQGIRQGAEFKCLHLGNFKKIMNL